MKKLILLLIITVSFSCKSQSNVINLIDRCNFSNIDTTDGNTYFKDISNVFDPYIGTWKWTSGNKEMTLVLTKQIKYHYNSYPDNSYEDRLVGYYIYKENGAIIADTSSENLMKDYGLKVLLFTRCDKTYVGTSMFIDAIKEKMISVTLEKLSPTQMKFEGEIDQHSSYVTANKPRTLYLGSTFPLDMVFTKQ